MPIIRARTHAEAYRATAAKTAFQALWQGQGEYTMRVAELILARVPLSPDDVVIDVGCGDGTLLAVAATKVREALGTAPNAEEVEVVRATRPHLRFIEGTNSPFLCPTDSPQELYVTVCYCSS